MLSNFAELFQAQTATLHTKKVVRKKESLGFFWSICVFREISVCISAIKKKKKKVVNVKNPSIIGPLIKKRKEN